MCRIAGIISKKQSADECYKKVALMCQAQQHGGPDDEGIFSMPDAGLVFGHRRLSIIDLSNNGHQPMADINKTAWITFNGEIYNYLQLKQALLSEGAQFVSTTDTEVILQAYIHWGTQAFEKLRGMFAFALHDTKKALTYLVRDSAGIKPLYYCTENEQLSFASEIKAFKKAGIALQPNSLWQIKFLAFGHIPEPDTTLNNVFSLPKSHMLCWHHQTSTYTIKPYSTTSTSTHITNATAARQNINHALQRAVKRQLIADAPLGVFLSGGIDSSLITLLAGEQKPDIKTVSIFFNEKAYDEHAYQQIVANKIHGEKFSHLVEQKDFEQALPQILNAMDMPTTDGINSWFISKYAHQAGLKAVLSGIGADELFGGYPSFNRIKYIKYLRSIPLALLKAGIGLVPDHYKKMAYLTQKHPLADYLFLRGLFAPADIAAILNCDEEQVYQTLFSATPSTLPSAYDEELAAWFETNLYMQNQLLRDTDVMSMHHGLEVRVPFLDEDFQNMVGNLSPKIKFDNKQPKKLLIDSFKDILPTQVWNRPKMGFSFPLQQWMNEHQEIGNKNFYKGKAAQNTIQKFNNNQAHWSKAFAVYQLSLHG